MLPDGKLQSYTCPPPHSSAQTPSSFFHSTFHALCALTRTLNTWYWRSMCTSIRYAGVLSMLSAPACTCVWMLETEVVDGGGSTGVRVGVGPIQTAHAADDVEKVNGCPGERHAETSETTARLFCLQTELLQLLLVLRRDKSRQELFKQAGKVQKSRTRLQWPIRQPCRK